MLTWVSGKLEYTEDEAASALGISIGQLRSLVRTHAIKEESGADVPIPSFRPTHLLLLKMLSEAPPAGGPSGAGRLCNGLAHQLTLPPRPPLRHPPCPTPPPPPPPQT